MNVHAELDTNFNNEISKIKTISFFFQNECSAYELLQQIPKYQT